MRRVLLALVLTASCFAGCTPDSEAYPLQPSSTNVPAGGVGGGGFGGGSDDGSLADAGTDGNDAGDGGARQDSGPFFDARPPDAAALLPDAQTDFPPFP
jgi:hypothetical protein